LDRRLGAIRAKKRFHLLGLLVEGILGAVEVCATPLTTRPCDQYLRRTGSGGPELDFDDVTLRTGREASASGISLKFPNALSPYSWSSTNPWTSAPSIPTRIATIAERSST